MTKIKIKKILIHNFLSFKDEEWDFDKTNRLVLIKGVNKDTESPLGNTSNGSGKSTWSHALMWALFGQLDGQFHVQNLKNLYDDTKRNGYTMFVDVEVDTIISANDVKKWRIVRGLQKSKAALLQLLYWDDESNDWKDISKSTTANTQKFIEDNVLYMNFEMYQRLVMLSIADKYNFFKLNAAQKREFVETLFDTSIYSKMYKMLCEDLKSRNLVLQNLKVNHVQLNKTKEICEDEIEKYKEGVNGQIETTTKEKDEKQSQLDGFDSQFEAIEEQRNVIQTALAKVRENKTKLDSIITTCNENITNARIDINNYNSTISHHERELNKHKEVLGMICDDCKVVVNKFYSLDVYRDEIDNLKNQILEKEGSIENAKGQISKIQELDDKLTNEETNKISELSDNQVLEKNLLFQKRQLVESIVNLEKRISDLVDSISNENKIPSFGVYKNTLDEIEKVESQLKEESMRLCLLKIGSDIVSPDAIKRNIISRVVASINAMINANLCELCVNFNCNLSTDMNDYEIRSDGGELDLSNLSAGEQMKLLLSLQMAFRKFLMSRFNVGMNVMIIDEVVDRALDSVSIQKLLGMLLHLSQKENTNISIISHRGEVEEMFKGMPETQLMVVQKENNISKIIRDQV